MIGLLIGDLIELGEHGELMIGRDGRLIWHHISAGPGDNAEIVAALRAA